MLYAMNNTQVRPYDVIIIGAGVAGCCTARELARFQLRCLLLEAGNDIACGASRANSGIVHAGFDPLPHTLKARYNIEGSRLYPQWAQELGFAYRQNGSLVLAFNQDDLLVLENLRERAELNGVQGARLITADEVLSLEPQVSPQVWGALLTPSAAICDPYGLAFTAAENAVLNGAEIFFNQRVTAITLLPTGGFRVTTECGDCFDSKVVINAAGLYADELNNLVSAFKLHITPVRGEYLLYDTSYGSLFSRIMFQAPNNMGKGVLVTPIVHGNLMIGPNAITQSSKEDLSTTREGMDYLIQVARKTWHDASMKGVISNFAGLRARGESGDFVIGEAPDVPGFFNIACFESPGLTAAPAVACDIAAQVASKLGAALREDFEPHNRHRNPVRFTDMNNEQRAQAIDANPLYGHVICRCCNVTEAEIVSELHSVLPVLSVDALKWRTGITMGRCHGGFCMPELLSIMSREGAGLPHEIDKRLPGSRLLVASNPEYARRQKKQDPSLTLRMTVEDVCQDDDCYVCQGDVCQEDVKLGKHVCEAFYDVVVIGGGAAGIAAAHAAVKASDAKARIALIDREKDLGGILKQCIHSGFGLHRFKEEMTGPEYAARELAELAKYDIEVMQQTTVLSIKNGARQNENVSAGQSDSDAVSLLHPHSVHIVYAVNTEGLHTLKARSIVLATGSRERGQGALGMSGSRPSGVFSAGNAQNIINLQGCLPGKKAVILGSGDIGLIMARRMVFQGAEVVGVYELMPQSSGLRRNIVQCLDDFDIPLYMSKTVTALEGANRLEAVQISDVDPQTLEVIVGTEQRVTCDTLLLSVGLLPENEIAKTAGVTIDGITGGAQVDNHLSTDVAGIFACGNALHIHDLVDHASTEGELAGYEAAVFAQSMGVTGDGGVLRLTNRNTPPSPVTPPSPCHPCPVIAGENIRYVVPQRIDQDTNPTADVYFSFRVSRPVDHTRFVIEGTDNTGAVHLISRIKAKVAVPAEMIQFKLKGSDVTGFRSLTLRIEDSPSFQSRRPGYRQDKERQVIKDNQDGEL